MIQLSVFCCLHTSKIFSIISNTLLASIHSLQLGLPVLDLLDKGKLNIRGMKYNLCEKLYGVFFNKLKATFEKKKKTRLEIMLFSD